MQRFFLLLTSVAVAGGVTLFGALPIGYPSEPQFAEVYYNASPKEDRLSLVNEADKGDILQAVIYLHEDDLILGPMTWSVAQRELPLYVDTGAELWVQGTLEFEVALDEIKADRAEVMLKRLENGYRHLQEVEFR